MRKISHNINSKNERLQELGNLFKLVSQDYKITRIIPEPMNPKETIARQRNRLKRLSKHKSKGSRIGLDPKVYRTLYPDEIIVTVCCTPPESIKHVDVTLHLRHSEMPLSKID